MQATTLPSLPTYNLTIKTAGHEQGIISIPKDLDVYFGRHGESVVVTLVDGQQLICQIERKNPPRQGARIISIPLKEYFHSKSKTGGITQYKVTITNRNEIRVKPIVELPSDPSDTVSE